MTLDQRFEVMPTARFSVVRARDTSAGDASVARDAASAAALVLGSESMREKVRLTRKFAAASRSGSIAPALRGEMADGGGGDRRVAEFGAEFGAPARPSNLSICAMSRVKQNGRKALIHSLVHAEAEAICLMWSLIAHFLPEVHPADVRDFVRDWSAVAEEEALHFERWEAHLHRVCGGEYGDLPAHDGLWASAADTRDSLLARLAVVHLVHEARGLDVSPGLMRKLENCRDAEGLAILRANLADEVGHVACALRWFRRLCARSGVRDEVGEFHRLVASRFLGKLKPPFSTELREQAGFGEEWYVPIASAT